MVVNRQDLLYVIRSTRRAPLLTFIVVLALSIGIGLNAGVFTILNFMFLQPTTKKNPSSFVQAYPRYEGWSTAGGRAWIVQDRSHYPHEQVSANPPDLSG